jgi:hypothetical protein
MSTVKGSWRGPNIVRDSSLVLYLDASAKNSYNNLIDVNTWKDLSRNNNSGSLINGPTFSGDNGGSIVFDAVNNYYSIGNNASLDCVNGVSVFTWVRSPSSYIQRQIIMKYNSVSIGIAYGFQFWSDQNIYFHITPTSGWLEVNGLSNYNLNTWYYLGLTYDQSNLKTYINGTVTSTTAKTGTITTNVYPVQSSSGLGCTLSGIQIYNRALTAAEISQNFNATRGRFGI